MIKYTTKLWGLEMATKKDLKTAKNNLVTQSNQLLQARAKMTLREAKIIKLLASYIRPEDKDFKEYVFSKRQLMDALEMGEANYSHLKKDIKGLMERVYEFKTDEGWLMVSAISSALYKERDDTITLSFDPKMRPYLLGLKESFTSAHLENFMGLRSLYALRMYELLKQREKLVYWRVQLPELRQMLVCENVMPMYGEFKRSVLLMTQDELREKTDIRFTFSEEKKRRAVVAIAFTIRHNPSKAEREELARQKRILREVDQAGDTPERLAVREAIKKSKPEREPDLF